MIIIQVICHDLGRHCEPYTPQVSSPALKAFSRDAVTFTNAHCAAPACSPSRGCLMTGCHSLKNGMIGLAHLGWPLRPEVKTITDFFNEAGVHTAHFGHQHERTNLPDNRYQTEGANKADANYCETGFGDALEFLATWDAEKPLYVNIGTIETHISEWGNMNRGGRRSLYGSVPEEEAYVPPFLPEEPAIRKALAPFEGCIRYFDSQFGRFIAGLKELGIYDRAMLVFTTDHGISGLRAKGTLYGHGTETALMIRLPKGIQSGRVITSPTTNIDLGPTMLDFAGVAIPDHMDGRSYLPLLRGERDAIPRRHIFIERNFHSTFDPMRAIRTSNYHYIRNFHPEPLWEWTANEVPNLKEDYTNYINEMWQPLLLPRPAEELYCLTDDPDETVNRADDPVLAQAKAELREQLFQWMRDRNDFVPDGPIPSPSDPSRFKQNIPAW
jgi:arylsulfatase A-like enzyme